MDDLRTAESLPDADVNNGPDLAALLSVTWCACGRNNTGDRMLEMSEPGERTEWGPSRFSEQRRMTPTHLPDEARSTVLRRDLRSLGGVHEVEGNDGVLGGGAGGDEVVGDGAQGDEMQGGEAEASETFGKTIHGSISHTIVNIKVRKAAALNV